MVTEKTVAQNPELARRVAEAWHHGRMPDYLGAAVEVKQQRVGLYPLHWGKGGPHCMTVELTAQKQQQITFNGP